MTCRRLERIQGATAVLAGIDEDLGVRLGIAKGIERSRHARESHGPGEQRRAVDLALGQHVQGVAEFQWRVTEYEAQVDLPC